MSALSQGGTVAITGDAVARTWRVIGGRQYAVPGDYATAEEDGTLTLLGRGLAVISTGGEKVFRHEVEDAIKPHPAVADAAMVGVAHSRFEEQVVAQVQLRSSTPDAPDWTAPAEHVKARLAGYKDPRTVRFVDGLAGVPSGKLDYSNLRTQAQASIALDIEP